jgi:hypothetical protein
MLNSFLIGVSQLKQRVVLFAGLALAFSTVAAASSVAVSGSSFGKATSGGEACGDLCTLPGVPDVAVLEQNYAYSGGKGEVYDFDISSLPPGTTGYTFTLTSSVPFVDNSSDAGYDFGAFVCKQLPKKTETQCGLKVPNSVTETANSKKAKDVSSVTFTVSGDNTDLVFYAIFSPNAVITTDLTLHSSAIPIPQNFIATPAIILAAPEPRLISLLLAALFLMLGYFRRCKIAAVKQS